MKNNVKNDSARRSTSAHCQARQDSGGYLVRSCILYLRKLTHGQAESWQCGN